MAKKPTKAQKKVEKVMREYGAGTLKSSSGQKVTSRKQAIAIAMSEAGMARKKPGDPGLYANIAAKTAKKPKKRSK